MEESVEKTEEEKLAEERERRKKSDLEFLSDIIGKIKMAKEKIEMLNSYVEKYPDTFIEWQNNYDKKDLSDCAKKIEDIIYRLSSVNKL